MELSEINSAEQVLKNVLKGWVKRDYQLIYDNVQLTFKKQTSPEQISENRKFKRVFAFWIGNAYVITDCSIDFDIKILTSKGFVKFRARMIKEKEPYLPSKYGTWGANLQSGYNSMGDPDSGILQIKIAQELRALSFELVKAFKEKDEETIWSYLSKSFKESTDRAEYFKLMEFRTMLDYKIKDVKIITPDCVDVKLLVLVLVAGEYMELQNITRVMKEFDSNGAYGWKINPYTHSNGLMNHAKLRTALSKAAGTKHTPAEQDSRADTR